MKEGLDFYYDGIYSRDMGLINCQVSSGMYEESFLSNRSIKEVKVAGRDRPYHEGVERSPLSFDLTFAFTDYYDEDKIRAVARWLNQDYYKPFYTTENPTRIFYCMLEGDSTLIHNGVKQGYITLTMRCNDSYTYSPKYTKENFYYGLNYETYTTEDDDYNLALGTFENLDIIDGNLKLNKTITTWGEIPIGTKWGDI